MNHVRIVDTEPRAAGDVENTRRVEFVISTSARDSHRTIVNQAGWNLDRYRRNGIVGYQHAVWGGGLCTDPNPDLVIGPGRAWVENAASPRAQLVGEWIAEPREINELSDKIFRKVLFGTLKATSVGFGEIGEGRWGERDEAEGQSNETYYFEGQELFEWSIVNMGSNPETVKRNLDPQVRAAIDYVKRVVPGLSTRDVMLMTVRDILAAVEGKPIAAAFSGAARSELRQTVPEFVGDTYTLAPHERRALAVLHIRNLT